MKNLFTLSFLLAALGIAAQNLHVAAGNLRLPLGIDAAADGKIWVTEVGTGASDGAVSILNDNGSLTPVVVGLPSVFDSTEMETVGPWRCFQLPNHQLGVVEPLVGGILVFDLTGFVPGVSQPLTMANVASQVIIADFVVANEPPGMPDTDPYSVAFDDAGNWYIADAAFNGIVKVNASTGERSVFATFPRFNNPLPFGPPMVDPVPTRILRKPGGGFYVCTLTGFPFLDGAAAVYSLDDNGTITPYATNMNLLTDMALDAGTGNLYVLQFGQFVLDPVMPGFAPGSAKVTRIKPDGTQEVIAQQFGPAAGLCLNAAGDLYITGIYAGLVWKLDHATSGWKELAPAVSDLAISPNPSNGDVQIDFKLPETSPVLFTVYDMTGKTVFTRQLQEMPAGTNRSSLDIRQQAPGVYFLEVKTQFGQSMQRLVLH